MDLSVILTNDLGVIVKNMHNFMYQITFFDLALNLLSH